jgi:hypothetical protein
VEARSGTNAPCQTRNPNVFKNNVAAIQLVLKCWVESAQFCGCKSDIGRCPPGVRLTKADERLAVENGWKPDQTDVSLVLGDDGVTFASDGERRRKRNVLRTACSGDDIYELVITTHRDALNQTGCRAFFIEDAYWVRREFGWFIKPFEAYWACIGHHRAQRERRVLPLFVGTDVETDYHPTATLRHVAANRGNAERWVPGL